MARRKLKSKTRGRKSGGKQPPLRVSTTDRAKSTARILIGRARDLVPGKFEKAIRDTLQAATSIRLRARLFWLIIGLVVPPLIAISLFITRTGELPSPFISIRRNQIVSNEFSRERDVEVRTVSFRGAAQPPTWLAFERDRFCASLFGFEEDFERTLDLMDASFDNRLLLFDEVDVGEFSPVLALTLPIARSMELAWPEGPRLLDATALDLDADGNDELLAYWLDYFGGSGGSIFPLVIRIDSRGNPGFETLPYYERRATPGSYTLFDPTMQTLQINGREAFVPINSHLTDVFWEFRQLDGDAPLELVMAYPEGDWDCHYCPQTWIVGTFQFLGGKFSPDADFPPFELPKEEGFGLPEIHGYTFVPPTGQIFFMWHPTWLDLDDAEEAIIKARRRSQAIDELLRRYVMPTQ